MGAALVVRAFLVVVIFTTTFTLWLLLGHRFLSQICPRGSVITIVIGRVERSDSQLRSTSGPSPKDVRGEKSEPRNQHTTVALGRSVWIPEQMVVDSHLQSSMHLRHGNYDTF